MKFHGFFSGKPSPEVRWRKDVGDLPVGRYLIEDYGRVLRITDIKWEDEAAYTCTGGNKAGSRTFTIDVDVQSKPTFIANDDLQEWQRFESQNVPEGGQVVFYCGCDPQTDPLPDIEILINTLPLEEYFTPRHTRSIVSENSNNYSRTLRFENVLLSDRMTIQCKISNIHGYILKNVYLNVLPGGRETPTTTVR